MKVEADDPMNHTLLRLLLEEVEMLRKDYSTLIESNSYSTVRRTKKHISNMRKILAEMSAGVTFRRNQIVDIKWGGIVPQRVKRKSKKKSETEPLIL